MIGNRNLFNRLMGGFFWNLLGYICSQGFVFISIIITARILGPEHFGKYAIIQSTMLMLCSVSGLGLGITATKYVSTFRTKDPEKVSRILGMCNLFSILTGIILTSVLITFASYISTHTLKAPEIIQQLRIASFYIFFYTVNGYQTGALVGFEAFGKLAKINIIQGIISLLVSFGLTYTFQLNGAALALGISSFTIWLYSHITLKKECKAFGIIIKYKDIWLEKDIFYKFIIPAATSGIILGLTVWISNAILVNQHNGYFQMAIFSASNNFRIVILFMPGLISKVVTPTLLNFSGNNNKQSYRKLFLINICISTFSALLIALVISLFSSSLLTLFGKQYIEGSVVVIIMSIVAVVEVVALVLYQNLYSHGNFWAQLLITLGWGLILISTTSYLVETLGALGLSLAYLFAWIFNAVIYGLISIYYSKKQLELGQKIEAPNTI